MNTTIRLTRARPLRRSALFLALLLPILPSAPLHAQEAKPPVEVLARVGTQDITVQEYAMALRTEARKRFYHAKPPEDVLAAFRREVADRLIERALAVQEAGKRGIKPDRKLIDTEMEKYRARRTAGAGADHDNKPFWEALRREMEQEHLLGKLRQQVDAKVKPTPAAVKAFYEQHPDKFTQPPQYHVSVILLRVAPSAAQPVWDAATREAEQIRVRMKAGSAFDELARVHSADASAAKGGDMGTLHQGMLASNVEEALDKLPSGGVTDPITVLEGVALFKLHEKKPERLGSFNEVKGRAGELLLKEQRTQAWQQLMTSLRAGTAIKLDERYLQSPAAAQGDSRGAPGASTAPPLHGARTSKAG